MAIFDEKIEIRERCKGLHCADLGESFPTRIYLQKSASIQPRTSPSKFGGKIQFTIHFTPYSLWKMIHSISFFLHALEIELYFISSTCSTTTYYISTFYSLNVTSFSSFSWESFVGCARKNSYLHTL